MTKPKPKQVLVTWIDPAARGGIDAKATITPAGIKLASKMARAGHPNYSIAAVMGLGRDSFRNAAERQPELRRALDTSLGELEAECVSALVTAMRKGQYSAAIFLLKGKFHFREAGPAPEQPGTQTQVNIIIPPRMTDQEYDRIIEDITPREDTEVIEGVVVQQKRITR